MEKISARQLGMVVFISIVGMKFVLVPALFSSFAGNDAYIAIAINLILDFPMYLVPKNTTAIEIHCLIVLNEAK